MMAMTEGKRTDTPCIEMIDMSRPSKNSGTLETQREATQRTIRDRQRSRHLEMMELDEYEPVADVDQKKSCGMAYAAS